MHYTTAKVIQIFHIQDIYKKKYESKCVLKCFENVYIVDQLELYIMLSYIAVVKRLRLELLAHVS